MRNETSTTLSALSEFYGTKSPLHKCECGGFKIVSKTTVAPLYAGQYAWKCDKCGKSGLGWSFLGKLKRR